MDNADGGGNDRGAEELILRTVAAHAESLLRTARRHSLCLDDAQDAYQRALEIFMANAERLDPARAPAWLHVVVKREAQAIRRARQRLVTADEVDLDAHESASLPTPEERLLTFDMLTRSAEALQRLKPHELRALWLKAQGVRPHTNPESKEPCLRPGCGHNQNDVLRIGITIRRRGLVEVRVFRLRRGSPHVARPAVRAPGPAGFEGR